MLQRHDKQIQITMINREMVVEFNRYSYVIIGKTLDR